eukprot:TRINITY_DN945_c0_g2_i1.p1 TRINITY_DN945_c0_g2~~TRINITY_DN945_c0_g2_i1.p1  ORF type:complete len:555 (+),score=81.46 TRINITY_DN945_c0_g2_i1:3052-4716(+)
MQNWNVSAGKRNGGPFDTATLRRSIDTGKLSPEAFVQSTDELGDWQQVCTVESLVDFPKLGEPRYCLECDCRATVAIDFIEKSIRCPSCFVNGPFVDYLDEKTVEVIGVSPEPWGTYDLAVSAFTVIAAALAISGGCALFFSPSLSLLLGFILLSCSAALFAVTFQHRSESSKYRRHLQRLESAFEIRSDLLVTTNRELKGLQRSLVKVRTDMVATTQAELNRKRDQIERELEIAKDQHNAVHRMAERFLSETRKWWTMKLNGENYQLTKERMAKAIEFCRKQGYPVTRAHEQEIFRQLKIDYEIVLKKEHEKAEQARVREMMREEQRAQREFQRELERTQREAQRQETEREAIQRALDEAMKRVGAGHSAEIQRLQESLQAAEERVLAAQLAAQRTKSQAELTRVGHVYVISNVGSFGENGYKVGLTRRLDPLDRVRELGDASVPFPFDVHMMIRSDDAPTLERKLHRALHQYRINRVNFRKEFFRVDLDTIRSFVEEHHGTVEYTYPSEESQYQQSLRISDADFAYLASVSEAAGMDDEDDDMDGADEPSLN